MNLRQHYWRGQLLGVVIFLIAIYTLPSFWCGRQADAIWSAHPGVLDPLAKGVGLWVRGGIHDSDFHTGSALFNAEWTFGSYFMAGMGLTQLVLRNPSMRGRYLPIIEACIDKLTHPSMRQFDASAWKGDALKTLGSDQGHAAYLGNFNMLLGLYRQIRIDNKKVNRLNRRISRALVRRLDESPIGMLETYPGQAYPVDNASVVGSIALFDRAEGTDHSQLIASWVAAVRRRYIDRDSGMLYQAVDPNSGAPRDKPRASGTALAAYYLSFAHRTLSSELYSSMKEACATSFLGFGLIKEYPPNTPGGRGDIDSGPVVAGISFSGTGFAMAAARVHGDGELFRSLLSTAYLVGTPFEEGGVLNFVAGGPLGNAIMLAMITAGPGGQW